LNIFVKLQNLTKILKNNTKSQMLRDDSLKRINKGQEGYLRALSRPDSLERNDRELMP
jgi:hypothetical protein